MRECIVKRWDKKVKNELVKTGVERRVWITRWKSERVEREGRLSNKWNNCVDVQIVWRGNRMTATMTATIQRTRKETEWSRWNEIMKMVSHRWTRRAGKNRVFNVINYNSNSFLTEKNVKKRMKISETNLFLLLVPRTLTKSDWNEEINLILFLFRPKIMLTHCDHCDDLQLKHHVCASTNQKKKKSTDWQLAAALVKV